jgi:hypothetical protein
MPLGTLRDNRHTRPRHHAPVTAAGPSANLECTRCGKRYYSAASRFARQRPACGSCLGDLAHISNGGPAA